MVESSVPLDCGNSGTTMRLLAGTVASCSFVTTLSGDASLEARPMERVAEPLRRMGARVATTDGHAPITVEGSALEGITYVAPVPSAQVKSAVLLAGVAAQGPTSVVEAVGTRDHTERALAALGAPITVDRGRVEVSRYQHEGFSGRVPGDPSSAAFLVAAATLTGGTLTIEGVGLNRSRTRFLDVLHRFGAHVGTEVLDEQVGEPVGVITVAPGSELHGTTIDVEELPLVIDEVPVLAAVAAHADGETSFLGAGELRVKESDRLTTISEGIRALGGQAGVEGDDLVVAGVGMKGGAASSAGDHRIAMALAVGASAASGPCTIDGIEDANVSFPGFLPTLHALGAELESS